MDFSAARRNMVENQLRTNSISDPRLAAALRDIPREIFLPRLLRPVAYVDQDVDLGGGRVLISPLVLARLLQGAGITGGDVVLAIGDATGWASAVISRLASTVVSLEQSPDLVSSANAALSDLGVDNVAMVVGPPAVGLPSQAPFDVIIFLGAIADIPMAVSRQLGDGGRLVAVVGGGGTGKCTQMVRVGDTFGRRVLSDAATQWLPGLAPTAAFEF